MYSITDFAGAVFWQERKDVPWAGSHGCATTTEAIRRAIQHGQESPRVLVRRYGINQKIVAKWKQRTSVADLDA